MDNQSGSTNGTIQKAASNAIAGLEAAVRNSRAEFVARLPEYYKTLDHAAEAAMGEGILAPSVDEVMFIAHRIAGVGKTLGFPDLGDSARQTETAIAAYRCEQDSTVLRDISFSKIRHLAGLIEAICAAHGKCVS
ncbi:MAG TPA: hypothetical protein ENK34_04795 [Rhodobacteraceae bacterium]|nr:hypothetical protein [Paracoccaceae bacterium]